MAANPHIPDAEFTPSEAFGGGWLLPRTAAGWDFTRRHVDGDISPGIEPQHPYGFMVEPWQVHELVEWAEVEGLALTLT